MEGNLDSLQSTCRVEKGHLEGLDADPFTGDIVKTEYAVRYGHQLAVLAHVECCHTRAITSKPYL
ncbi:hypothetical protein DPMN_093859 [Dreissena polymorpha]|uniref:Uncharacterized protein n=1 Tax=Dreissena polymorpha TaxID=45954 RepID=A0A9D4L4W5_DREPO|nr:hypothetical protein DPMN_090679 [Dreissena polymorpha]KAH3851379.1 hypothetical protein DPMN_093859 [Dreissena polymorpha]